MELKFQLASDGEAVRKFYYDIIDALKTMPYRPMWEKGIYPTDEFLQASVDRGELTVALAGEEIVGAMILNHSADENYGKICWSVAARPEEVTVIHALGVIPHLNGQGIGKKPVQEAIRLCREQKQKTIRLDALAGNLPAEKLYPACGFRYMGTEKMFYEDTGWKDFLLYEYVL